MSHQTPLRKSLAIALTAAIAVALVSPPAQGGVSDWIAQLHGVAPRAPKAPPPAAVARVSTASGHASDPQVESFLRTLAAAVMARDGSLVAPRLATNYAVEGAPAGATAADFLAQAIEQMRGPAEIVVESVEPDHGLRTVKARFRFGANDESVKTFILDSAGSLVASDLFRLSHG